MDALSSNEFQPIHPDGPETPKIEITETENVCHPPLSPPACDVLCEWDDFHHHGDNGSQGDYLAEKSSRQRHESCEARSRRGEGGPGKSPSPSRNSPRRHSPVPYSPKRLSKTRSSEEFGEVSLSPRRHSAIPVLPHVDRPCSLSLTSAASEDFICVSYADPFSSPTITHTSDGILAISINCSHDAEDSHDVEMTPSDVNHDHSGSVSNVVNTSDPTPNSSIENAASQDKRSLLQERNVQESPSKHMYVSQDVHTHDISNVPSDENDPSTSVNVHTINFNDGNHRTETISKVEHSGVCLSEVSASKESKTSHKHFGESSVLVATESMEGHDDFRQVTDSESSSDDEMEDFVNPSITYGVGMSISCPSDVSGLSAAPGRSVQENTSFPCSIQYDSVSDNSQNYEASHISNDSISYHSQADFPSASFNDSSSDRQPLDVNVDQKQGSNGNDHGQRLPIDNGAPSWWSVADSKAPRRASFPDHRLGLCTSPLASFPSKEASPRRSISHHVTKTPDDFSLPCVIGSPPLHFPHCRHVVLVHHSMPSPYDPDLPTPPIVLTPHTSYDDLNKGFNTAEGAHRTFPGVRLFSPDSSEETSRKVSTKPNISRSRSFPKFHESEQDRFQEPHQVWPTFGSHAGDVGSSGRTDINGGDSGLGRTEDSDMNPSDSTTSVSLPGSPSNSRAAVIGRLRRVVERRLSGTIDPCLAAVDDG